MNTITIFTLIISLMALLVTYAVFKSDQQPQIIVFALPHYGKQSFIQLHIKNIGKSIAYNVQISSDQPIPKRAFGIKKLNASKSEVTIKVLESEKRSFFDILAPRIVKVELTVKENISKALKYVLKKDKNEIEK